MSNFFQRKNVTNYVSPEISIGFGPFGPTLTISGVLSSPKHVVMVNSLGIAAQVPFHQEKKTFDWFAFQTGSTADANLGVNIQAPSKFVLFPNQSKQYNILFVDNDCYAMMKMVLSNILSSWEAWVQEHTSQKPADSLKDFKNIPLAREMHSSLRQMCYWKAGRYHIDIIIQAKENTFVTKKSFSAEEGQVESLRENSDGIISSLCSQPVHNYNTVTVSLQDRSK